MSDLEDTSMCGENMEDVLRELKNIRAYVSEATMPQPRLNAIHDHYQESAQNLLHYLALRHFDLRALQVRLAALGLSSLGRSESHVLAALDRVLEASHRLVQRSWQSSLFPIVDFAMGQQLLADHTEALLGPVPSERGVRIMVTMSTEAAYDRDLVHDLVAQGMDCMRINCAHDDPETWLKMIQHLRHAEKSLGRSCRVVMDLAGPKLRTGPIEPGPSVMRVRPQRDVCGQIVEPARVWLSAEGDSPPTLSADACLVIPKAWLAGLEVGEKIRFRDARGSKRAFVVVEATDNGCWVEARKTAYLVPGTVFRRGRASGHDHEAVVGDLPPSENPLVLQQGDQLILTRDLKAGRPAVVDHKGHVLTPATIGCTLPQVFDDVRLGESVWFDDGKIGGVIECVESERVCVKVTYAREGGRKLRADKGINFPESDLRLGALMEKDVEDLSFVAQHADVVEMSFVNTAEDVALLQQHLDPLSDGSPAIVLKIETQRGFENLPDMLLTAMRWPRCGVMIARGDLAVECGFERLAEVQEEILWICEAAHVPVIWATQVLENLAKNGMPSRAEITDAAMGHRAECVMLNKGPHVGSAVRALDDILRRMQAHQAKKRSMLRELRLAHTLPDLNIPI